MLEFSDAPYQFFAPRPSRPLIRIGRALNRWCILPGPNHRIHEIRVDGELDALNDAILGGDRILFAINHPSHSDPQVVTEIQRRLGIPACFMAAYDVFLRSRLNAWAMTRTGTFSIDREGADRKAMATAIQVLGAGDLALNIFPEGNVYLTNDRVTPFLDGAAFIALKAQAALGERPVRIVPLSLKFTHLTTPRDAITARMLKLGADSGYTFPDGSSENPLSAVLGLGRHILGQYLEKHGASMPDDAASLFATLGTFASHLLDGVETGLGIPATPGSPLVSRIARARTKIHQLRTDPDAAPHPEIDGLADRTILALRIHGYLTPYLTEHPTIDRYDETVERIAEDFYSTTMPRTGPRRAVARVGTPIDVRGYLAMKSREAIAELSKQMETRVQAGLDAINAENTSPGGAMVRS